MSICLTRASDKGMLALQFGKICTVRNASLSISRRSNRVIRRGFSMSGRYGSRSRLPLREAVLQTCFAQAPECKLLSGFNLNSRRAVMRAKPTPVSKSQAILLLQRLVDAPEGQLSRSAMAAICATTAPMIIVSELAKMGLKL